MNTRKFLSVVWPQRGPYCIATPWVTPEGKKVYAHRGCDTLDDVIAYVLQKKQSKDLYFAPHTLKIVRQENPETGKLQDVPNACEHARSHLLLFDIDPGEHYATLEDILNALEKFLFRLVCRPRSL